MFHIDMLHMKKNMQSANFSSSIVSFNHSLFDICEKENFSQDQPRTRENFALSKLPRMALSLNASPNVMLADI